MARYSAFLGLAVEVQYRAGDICLPASGMFVGDSGRSIFLVQHYEQDGQSKNFRWEIPYPCIVRLEESATMGVLEPKEIMSAPQAAVSDEGTLHAKAAHASGGSTLVPVGHRPETA
jgi:hypothetical protein